MALNEVFEAVVEPTLQQPTFVMDHPLEISPLAKPHRSKPGCVERWELFIAGAPCTVHALPSACPATSDLPAVSLQSYILPKQPCLVRSRVRRILC